MSERLQGATAKRILLWAAVAAIVVFCLFPFYWLINTSLKSGADLSGAALLPPSPSLDNYTSIFEDTAFTNALRNSAIIAGSVTVLSLLIGSFAGYALARLHLPFKFLILAIVLSISTFPADRDRRADLRAVDRHRPLQHLPRPDPAVARLRAAPDRLHHGLVLPRHPAGAGGGRAGRRGDAHAGVPQSHRCPRRTRGRHRGPAGLHLRLEPVPVRDHPDQHAGAPAGARGDRLLHRQPAVRGPAGDDQCRVRRGHDPPDCPRC